jgi:NAD(P)-dependent dehydrogenase (short-subunit alcohol dehydrogenase family)
MSLRNTQVIVIGGTAGIGRAVAAAAATEGAQVVVVSSSQDRVDAAVKQLPDSARGVRLDVTSEPEVRRFFADEGEFDHLVYTAGEPLLLGPVTNLDPAAARAFFETRYWGAFWAAKHAAGRIRPGGSISFTSGSVATRPGPGTSVAAAVTGAVESLSRALAVEFAPARVRVNAVRPGPVRTGMWDGTVPDPQALYDDFSGRILAGRVGEPWEIAMSFIYLMASQFTTGTIVTIDGGAVLA